MLVTGLALALVVAVGTPRADGGLSALSGLLVTVPLMRLAGRAMPPPDWRFGVLLVVAACVSLTVRVLLDWAALQVSWVLLFVGVLSLDSRSSDAARRRRRAPMEERLASQREREARIRREYPEEFQPAPWERVG